MVSLSCRTLVRWFDVKLEFQGNSIEICQLRGGKLVEINCTHSRNHEENTSLSRFLTCSSNFTLIHRHDFKYLRFFYASAQLLSKFQLHLSKLPTGGNKENGRFRWGGQCFPYFKGEDFLPFHKQEIFPRIFHNNGDFRKQLSLLKSLGIFPRSAVSETFPSENHEKMFKNKFGNRIKLQCNYHTNFCPGTITFSFFLPLFTLKFHITFTIRNLIFLSFGDKFIGKKLSFSFERGMDGGGCFLI